MEKITELMNNLDLGKLVPQMDKLMDWVLWLAKAAVRIGPVCILLLGLIYLLIPPKEANRKAGYRTYFGMGSITAWQFTQRLSGVLMTLTGLILTIIALVSTRKFSQMAPEAMVEKALSCIKGQIICVLIIFVLMFLVTAVLFDRKGYYRFPIDHSSFPGNLLPPEDLSYVPVKKSGSSKTKRAPASPRKPFKLSFPSAKPSDPVPSADPYSNDPYAEPQEGPLTADDIVIEDL
jgi:hypothetical protein